MKCTNKRLLSIYLSLIILISLTGCGNSGLNLAYRDSYNYSTDGVILGTADTFSKDLCVINDDERGKLGNDVEDTAAAGLFCVDDKTVLYAKDVHKTFYPASLTKVMTALVAIKYGNMTDTIVCSENVDKLESGASRCGLKPGDRISMDDALHALLVSSANDAAIAIAEHVSGTTEGFVALMNKEARALGATNTNFVNPNGLNDEEHYTTVYDLYLITNAAVKYDYFINIISDIEYQSIYKDSEGNDKKLELKTTNLFLKGDYSSPDTVTVIGGKTGTTNAALNCLIQVVGDKQNKTYIAIILHVSERDIINSEMEELLQEITAE